MRTEKYINPAGWEIPVVLAADRGYVPVLFTCLKSLVDCAAAGRSYHIYIMHTDIRREDMQVFQKELACGYIRIDFIDVSAQVAGYSLRAKEHITTETFYRFLIPELFKDCPKVVYLDVDTIICKDIAQLYDYELGNSLLAAAPDPDFIGQYYGANADTRHYCKEVLKLKKPDLYVQAGVLVIHVRALGRAVRAQKLFHMAEKGNYRYSDQDILNIACEGRIKNLSMSWNMMTDSGRYRRQVIRSAPAKIREEYRKARKQPCIIHYAGSYKPWKYPDADFAHVFWKYARQTPYYEEMLFRMLTQQADRKKQVYLNRLLDMVKQAAKAALPPDSRIRGAVTSLYWKMK